MSRRNMTSFDWRDMLPRRWPPYLLTEMQTDLDFTHVLIAMFLSREMSAIVFLSPRFPRGNVLKCILNVRDTYVWINKPSQFICHRFRNKYTR